MARAFKQPLYLRPDDGMFKGVCAGVAHYLDVPVKLVRIIVVLSMFFGLFLLTILAYAILAYWLEPAPSVEEPAGRSRLEPAQELDLLELQLQDGGQRLREVERYVTSDAFGLRNRFRQL